MQLSHTGVEVVEDWVAQCSAVMEDERVSINGGTDDTDVWVEIRRGPRRPLRV